MSVPGREDWMASVTMDMLPEAHRKFAEIIGVEATLRLCAEWGGAATYGGRPC